jgi:hypothetical protein
MEPAPPTESSAAHALPGDFAPRDAQDLMAYPFFSLSKSHRTAPIDFVAGDVSIRVEAVPDHGMATIWDADILIWAASQMVEARDAGLHTSRLRSAVFDFGGISPIQERRRMSCTASLVSAQIPDGDCKQHLDNRGVGMGCPRLAAPQGLRGYLWPSRKRKIL